MAYQENIPQPTDKIKDSQNDLLNNFQAIKTAWDVNHVTYDLGDQGKHKHVSLPEQAAAPATAANELAIYSKQSALTGISELFVRRESSGTELEATGASLGAIGWSYLPSGLLIKWGVGSCTGNDTFVLPAGAGIPDFTAIYSIQLTVADPAITDIDQAIRATSFVLPGTITVFASNRSTTGAATVGFEYLLIGI